MAYTDITPTPLVINTESADLTDAAGCVVVGAGTAWNILAAGNSGDRLLIKLVNANDTGVATFTAGARPPSQRTGLGTKAVSLTANQVKYICVEASRFLQANGTILVTPSGNTAATMKCGAFLLPKGG